MNTYKAAVIGAGIIAKVHMKTLHENEQTSLAAVADIDAERAGALAAPYGATPYVDYRRMVREERPDIVVVTLPHFLHKEAAIWCAEQGCHVLLEKPMAMDAAECADINAAGDRCGVVIAVGHMQHYFPAVMRAKQMIESGSLGRLVMINDRRHHFYFNAERPAWFLDRARSGGGIVRNLGSHSIDKIQWLTGSAVTKVKAHLTHCGERGDVEGSGLLYVQTASGVPAVVSLCGYHNVSVNETELLFTGGQLKIGGARALWIGSDAAGYEPVDLGEAPEPFAAQWRDMLHAVESGSGPVASGAYGQSVAAAVDAAYRSHETGAEQTVEPVGPGIFA
ncbi:Gfo/Idh/MocA family protein [Paenibacillus sp. GYB003]|uniref:Gfo/Idh/MocA family protein n=1 Tax=Paenibacillus sp. GYB003 TaxID=2994392 RepID=UPI002F969B06